MAKLWTNIGKYFIVLGNFSFSKWPNFENWYTHLFTLATALKTLPIWYHTVYCKARAHTGGRWLRCVTVSCNNEFHVKELTLLNIFIFELWTRNGWGAVTQRLRTIQVINTKARARNYKEIFTHILPLLICKHYLWLDVQLFQPIRKLKNLRAVVVAQLVERSLQTPVSAVQIQSLANFYIEHL